jgi:hypothetical protein
VTIRFVGSKVIRELLMLTTALSLGAAVCKANTTVNLAHKVIVNNSKGYDRFGGFVASR